MDHFPTDRSELVSRRRALQLATVGVAVSVGSCARWGRFEAETKSAVPSSPALNRGNPAITPEAGPQTAATVPPIDVPSTTSAALLCREAWGARPPRAGGTPHTIKRMTIHHTAVVLGDNRNSPARLRQHQRYHQDDHGWIDIAYHVGVDRNGNIFELRTTDLAGDTATPYDTTGHFLVVCEGDFDQEQVTEEQLHGSALAFAWAAQTFNVTPDTLAGHRDFASTSCPGASLYSHLSSGDLKHRIDDLLAIGKVDLHRVCGDDAAATVAAIEAGH